MRMIAPLALSLALSAGSVAATANPGLRYETDINNGLFAVVVADKIRRECNTISARFFRARAYLKGLKKMALERGYSKDEIDAYINDEAEKDRMDERRNRYFDARGASRHNAQSLCDLGHEEIANKSQIGLLLRAK